jgi:DNA-binding CsgD family transcriptional regulator
MAKSFIDNVREVLENLPFDDDLQKYKHELFNEINLNKLVVFSNQFFYITDMQSFNNVYVHKNLKHILGHETEHYKKMENIYRDMHPEDHDFVLAYSKKIIGHAGKASDDKDLANNPHKITFSIDFRIKTSEGNYLRVNSLTSSFKLDRHGNLVYAISLLTDIDHIKKSNNISYSWSGIDSSSFSLDDLKNPPQIFSKRETDILKYLVNGLKGNEIAKKLNITGHTVISHRKNMLRKTRTKNTAELVHFAVSKGLI